MIDGSTALKDQSRHDTQEYTHVRAYDTQEYTRLPPIIHTLVTNCLFSYWLGGYSPDRDTLRSSLHDMQIPYYILLLCTIHMVTSFSFPHQTLLPWTAIRRRY
jgi:hypothetical protein